MVADSLDKIQVCGFFFVLIKRTKEKSGIKLQHLCSVLQKAVVCGCSCQEDLKRMR